jgi:glycosyltransferase involved in cell wall biosynthesis
VPKVSSILITRNEERRLADALDSVRWADEIVVVDACSRDGTIGIAKRYTDRVVVREWPGFVEQKNYAASIAANDWILSIDADERVTPALAREIGGVLAAEPAAAGYRMPRCSFYLGAWIRTTDWYPDYQVRLYDRRRARWTGKYVHESVTVDGATGTLRSDLQHHPYTDVSDHLARMDTYTTLAANQMSEDRRRARALDFVTHPAAAFLRNYVLKGGFRQGSVGLAVSALNSYYVFLKFAKLWELQRPRPGPRGPDPEP